MATRPAWTLVNGKVRKYNYDFVFNAGFSVTQKQKNVAALHKSIGEKALEVSTKSLTDLGKKCSAFNLKLNGIPLECVFQAGKVYEHGGHYLDLLEVAPKNAKRDPRHKESGKLVSFVYQDKTFPLEPKTLFYDYLYCNAIRETIPLEVLKEITEYEFFTDIEFIPSKSINCQARSIVIVKAMLEQFGEIPDLSNLEEFYVFSHSLGVAI